jgi:hypothetical protein
LTVTLPARAASGRASSNTALSEARKFFMGDGLLERCGLEATRLI